MTVRQTRTNLSGAARWQTSFGYAWNEGSGADSSVYKQATIGGSGVWSYVYDPNGRRIQKATPVAGMVEEFFYMHETNELLEDRGLHSSNSMFGPGSGSGAPIDEYLWLGGRPVAFVRAKFDSSWNRLNDFDSGGCQRNGEAAPCGVYFPITDHIGKPIAVIDSSRRISASLEYDPFGMPNRKEDWAATPEPYANNSNLTLATMSLTPGAGETVRVRPVFYHVDTEPKQQLVCARFCNCQQNPPADYAYIADAVTLADVGGGWKAAGRGKGPTKGVWVSQPASGATKIQFVSDGVNCPSACNCNTTNNPYTGVAYEGFEYRRYQTGSTWVSTPLRFRGHYHDEETDLFENWNRYYDPFVGRYWQPEPLLQNPQYVVDEARYGAAVHAYAYAGSNPVMYFDSDGMIKRAKCYQQWVKAEATLGGAFGPASCTCTLTQAAPNGAQACFETKRTQLDATKPEKDCPELENLKADPKACSAWCDRITAPYKTTWFDSSTATGGWSKVSCPFFTSGRKEIYRDHCE